jgi:hypothetical protein
VSSKWKKKIFLSGGRRSIVFRLKYRILHESEVSRKLCILLIVRSDRPPWAYPVQWLCDLYLVLVVTSAALKRKHYRCLNIYITVVFLLLLLYDGHVYDYFIVRFNA